MCVRFGPTATRHGRSPEQPNLDYIAFPALISDAMGIAGALSTLFCFFAARTHDVVRSLVRRLTARPAPVPALGADNTGLRPHHRANARVCKMLELKTD